MYLFFLLQGQIHVRGPAGMAAELYFGWQEAPIRASVKCETLTAKKRKHIWLPEDEVLLPFMLPGSIGKINVAVTWIFLNPAFKPR